MKTLNTIFIALSVILTFSGEIRGEGMAHGLVLYVEPPRTWVNAAEFVTIANTSVAYTTLSLTNGQKEEIPRSGVLAVVNYPPEVQSTSFPNDAAAATRNIQALLSKYPQYAAKLNNALSKWTNALAFYQQKQKAASAAPRPKPTPGTTLEIDGVKYSDAILTSFDGSSVGIDHSAGFARIPANKLKPEQIAALNATTSSVRIDSSKIVAPAPTPAATAGIENADAPKLRSEAIAAVESHRFQDALRIISEALKADRQNPLLLKTLAVIGDAQTASLQLERAKAEQIRVAAEVVRIRKNAAVTNRSNPLNPNDSSGRHRSAAMTAQADQLEKSARQALTDAENHFRLALDAVEIEGRKPMVASNAGVPSPSQNAPAPKRAEAEEAAQRENEEATERAEMLATQAANKQRVEAERISKEAELQREVQAEKIRREEAAKLERETEEKEREEAALIAVRQAETDRLKAIEDAKIMADEHQKLWINIIVGGGVLCVALCWWIIAVNNLKALFGTLRSFAKRFISQSNISPRTNVPSTGGETISTPRADSLSLKRLALIAVCILGLGWILCYTLPGAKELFPIVIVFFVLCMAACLLIFIARKLIEKLRPAATRFISSFKIAFVDSIPATVEEPKPDTCSDSLSLKNLVPMAVFILGFGWALAYMLPMRQLNSTWVLSLGLIGIPAVYFASMAMLNFLRPRRLSIGHAFGAFFFTMIAGLALLIIFQEIAMSMGHSHLRFVGGEAGLWYYAVHFIGSSYNDVIDPNPEFSHKLGGYIFAVGPCEEFTKLLPLFFIVLSNKTLPLARRIPYRGFLAIGFFSGLGFGVGEALYCYSPMNGHIYVSEQIPRWFAVVPSHGVWSTTAAGCLWMLAPWIQTAKSNRRIFFLCCLAAVCTALLHGIYDAVCVWTPVAIFMAGASLLLLYKVVSIVETKTKDPAGNEELVGTGEATNWLMRRALAYQGSRVLFRRGFALCAASILAVTIVFSTPPNERPSPEEDSTPWGLPKEMDYPRTGYQSTLDPRRLTPSRSPRDQYNELLDSAEREFRAKGLKFDKNSPEDREALEYMVPEMRELRRKF